MLSKVLSIYIRTSIQSSNILKLHLHFWSQPFTNELQVQRAWKRWWSTSLVSPMIDFQQQNLTVRIFLWELYLVV